MKPEIVILVIFTVLYFGRSIVLPDIFDSPNKTVVETGISQ
jgi:hypothetical protein